MTRADWPDRPEFAGRTAGLAAALAENPHDRFDDIYIPGATAKIAAELEPYSFGSRIRNAQDNISGCHQHTRRAEAALQTMLFSKRSAQRHHDGIVFKALDGANAGAIAHHGVCNAGTRRLTIDQQRACAACALLATQMRAGQIQVLPQEVSEMHTRFDRVSDLTAIHMDRDLHHGDTACRYARDRAATC